MDDQITDEPKDTADLEGAVRDLTVKSAETTEAIVGLEEHLGANTDELRRGAERDRRRTKARFKTVAVVAVALLVGILGSWVQIQLLQKKMCPMVTSILPRAGEAQPEPGPKGDRGRIVIGRFANLAKDFGCGSPEQYDPPSPTTPTPMSAPTFTPPTFFTTPATRSTHP